MMNSLHKAYKWGLRYPLETFVVYLAYVIASSLSIERSSSFFGWLGKKVGGFSKATQTSYKNLRHAFPDITPEEQHRITQGVWDNFSRVMGEYPRLHKINVYKDDRFEIVGAEYIDQMREDGKPAIIVGAHLASWEVGIMAATQRGLKLSQLYRTVNNPWVDWLVRKVQEKIGQEVLAKGAVDGRRIVELLRKEEHLFILIDQKLNTGIAVPFFGRNAMTAPAAARLAIKFDCPLVPVQVERLGGVRFRVTFHPPLKVPKKPKNVPKAIYELTLQINQALESWIRQHPEQWLWIHQRWPKEK